MPLLLPGAKFIFMSSGSSILDRVPDNNNVCYGITKVSCQDMACANKTTGRSELPSEAVDMGVEQTLNDVRVVMPISSTQI